MKTDDQKTFSKKIDITKKSETGKATLLTMIIDGFFAQISQKEGVIRLFENGEELYEISFESILKAVRSLKDK